jgi:hypothetical protein
MSSKLESMKSELSELSVSELLSLMEQLAAELRHKTTTNGNTKPAKTKVEPQVQGVRLPHAYRPTKEQVEASLNAIFKPEDLAQMGRTDFSKLPPLPKTITEYLSEDREDRF